MPLDDPAAVQPFSVTNGTRKAPQGNRCTMPPAWESKTKIPDKKVQEKPPVLASLVSPRGEARTKEAISRMGTRL